MTNSVTDQVIKLLNEYYSDNWRELEEGREDFKSVSKQIDALCNKPVSTTMKYPIRLLSERLRNQRQLHKKLSRIKKTETANALSRIIERKDEECNSLMLAISVLKRIV